MITGFLINAFYILFYNVISILPDAGTGLPSGFVTALHQFWNYFNAFNFIFPVDSIISILSISITFEVGILLVKLIMWLIRTVRGGGS